MGRAAARDSLSPHPEELIEPISECAELRESPGKLFSTELNSINARIAGFVSFDIRRFAVMMRGRGKEK